jgi:hypothetical protein
VYAIGPQDALNNAGAISGVSSGGVGVYLEKGGSITNQSTGVISGVEYGAELDASSSYANTLLNSGKITGVDGVLLQGQGGAATNNAGGTISGTQAGVMINGMKGSVTNAGMISGGAYGVFTEHGASVMNTGVITGATAAVAFTGRGTNTLALGTGSVLNGAAIGSTTGQNFLDLEGHGIAANTFENFDSVTVAGFWELTGASTVGAAAISSGQLQIGDASHGSAQLIVDGALANKGVLAVGGGLLDVQGAVRGNGAVSISGGVAEFDGTFDENVTFTGASGTLRLGESSGYHGAVTGLSPTGGAQLDLKDVSFVGAGEATFAGTSSGGTLTVTGASTQAKVTLFGNYLASTFVAASDGHGGTLVSAAHTAQSQALLASHPH